MLKKISFVVVLLALIGVGAYQFLLVDTPYATKAIPLGTVITSSDVVVKKTLITNVPKNALTEESLIVGKMAEVDIPLNSLFFSYLVSQESVNTGSGNTNLDADHVMVSLIVLPENAPSSLNVGDTVNIVAYFAASQAGTHTPFAVSFPYPATIQSVKKDDSGKVSGFDVVTHKSIATELTVASIQGTLALVEVAPETDINTFGSSVDDLFTRYYYAPVTY